MNLFSRRDPFIDSIERDEESTVVQKFHGSVSGVDFDFRFEGFSSDDWTCPRFITEDSRFYIVRSADDGSPSIDGIAAQLENIGLEQAQSDGRDVLFKGDLVRTQRVFIHRVDDDELTPDPDRDVAAAFLEVVRSDGSIERLKVPLLFWPIGSLLLQRRPADALSVFSKRLAWMSAGREEEVSELAAQSAHIRRLKHRIQFAFWDQPKQATGGLLDRGIGRFASMAPEVSELVNEALLNGYRQGWLEASVKMEPLARKKLAHVLQAHEAGRGNRDAVREKFAEAYKLEFPNPTVASATKAFLNLHPTEDASSVRRSFKRHFPLNKDALKD